MFKHKKKTVSINTFLNYTSLKPHNVDRCFLNTYYLNSSFLSIELSLILCVFFLKLWIWNLHNFKLENDRQNLYILVNKPYIC